MSWRPRRRYISCTNTHRYMWGTLRFSYSPRLAIFMVRRHSASYLREAGRRCFRRSRNWEWPHFIWRPRARTLSLGRMEFTYRYGPDTRSN